MEMVDMRRMLQLVIAMTAIAVLAPEIRAQGGEGGSDSVSTQLKSAKRPKRSRNRISLEEVAYVRERGARTAYDAIQQLHTEWFHTRGATGSEGRPGPGSDPAPGGPVIYIDQARMGDDSQRLRDVPLEAVREIRFLSAPEATARYGSGYQHGAIIVTTG
jgi:hypothetical protein